MTINISIKNVPEALAAKLRECAERNHRSLQAELMAILENAVTESDVGTASHEIETSTPLLDRLLAIAEGRGIDTSKRLTRDQIHDRKVLRNAS